jgi:SAM-dependent methyltransferase
MKWMTCTIWRIKVAFPVGSGQGSAPCCHAAAMTLYRRLRIYDRRPLQMALSFSRFFFRYRRWGIADDDLVLDVGSGAAPNPRANVLCDRAAGDSVERERGLGLVFDRPAVLADAERLPFRDGAFDFVICAHVLEHVADPERVVRELTRVGKRGYIETPSPVWERLHGTPYHRWTVWGDGGTLHFRAKPGPVLDPELDAWRARADVEAREAMLALHYHLYEAGMVTEFLWDGPFDVAIDRSAGNGDFVAATGGGDEWQEASGGLKERVKHALSRAVRRRSNRRLDLVSLLQCVRCGGSLGQHAEALLCTQCGATVPLIRGVPDFLAADERVAR